ncbi:MAG: SMP-30/gluconolactonase/LRE family protein [Isosphaeraceae bacterium]|nr:SMP-30/gluconolactonase/LRE family protein [Isosphaeraceae bacterium]
MEILRNAGLSDLVAGDLETISEGHEFTEGPLQLPDGSILFQDLRRERTLRWSPREGTTTLRESTAAANGQTFGPDGHIYSCEQNGRRISRMRPDGAAVEVVAETWSGKRLNSPNDIVARADGSLYFTDPPYGVAPADRSLHFQGVYRLGRDGSIDLVLDDFEKPNGIALSPDGSTLYVCDTARYHVRCFRIEDSGRVAPRSGRVFASLDPGVAGGPDGLKVDLEGRVYVAVALGIWVHEPDGRLIGILATPKRPSNLAWVEGAWNGLVITAVDRVHRVELRSKGLLPPFLPVSDS